MQFRSSAHRSPLFWPLALLLVACNSTGEDETPGGTPEGAPPVAGSGGTEMTTASGGNTLGVIDLTAGSGGTSGEVSDGAGGTSMVNTSVQSDCARTEVSAVDTTTIVPADIIILVDTSGSMSEEAAFVQENLNAFSQQITQSGVDARVILIAAALQEMGGGQMGGGMQVPGLCIAAPLGSGSCPDDTLLPSYVHVAQEVGSVDALDVLIDTFPEWQPHLRANSSKFIFVVSDDDAGAPAPTGGGGQSEPNPNPEQTATEFIQEFESLAPELLASWTMNAVYSFTECEAAARVGVVYDLLVGLTGGVEGDLCLQDFQPVFDRLAEQVIANAGSDIACEWEIPTAVDGQTFSTELVDVTRTSTGGVTEMLTQVARAEDCHLGAWHFDDPKNPLRILACPDTCAAIQDDAEGEIDIVFGCEIVEGCAATGATSLSTDVATACEWSLPVVGGGQQVDVENVNVQYVTQTGFGVLLGQVETSAACETADLGWYYDNPENPSLIVACPNTCQTLQEADVIDVQALFGCETRPAVIR